MLSEVGVNKMYGIADYGLSYECSFSKTFTTKISLQMSNPVEHGVVAS